VLPCFLLLQNGFNAKGARLYPKVCRVIFPAFLNRKDTEGIRLIRACRHCVTLFPAASKWFLTQRTQSFIARFAECFSCLFGLENRMGYEVKQNMSPLCYLVSCCFKMVFNAKGAKLCRKVRREIFPAFLNRKGTQGIR